MKYKSQLKKTADKVFPKGTKRRKVVQKAKHYSYLTLLHLRLGRKPFSYARWIKNCEPGIWSPVDPKLKLQPIISVLVPAYNTPDKYIIPLLNSLINQTYANWQLCIADGSTDEERAARIKELCAQDGRISYKRLTENKGIALNTNEALKLAKGEFVGFLDHDDLLSPHALNEVITELNKHPDTDLFYSDEDKLSDDGRHRHLPFFKPGWSPSLLEGVNYMTHFCVVRHSVIAKVGGLRGGYDGSQDYDFILRVTDYSPNVTHISKVLYHWRVAEGSTAGQIGNKNYADDAGQRALRDHVKRQKIDAEVQGIEDQPTNYRLKYAVPKGAKASIIIPFKDKPELLEACVGSIFKKTTYPNYEIILVSNNSVEAKTHNLLAKLKEEPKCKVHYWNHPFNYSAVNNFGRSQASGDYIVLLNNDTEVITGEWLEELLGVASQPWAGAVGPLLFYPNNKIQHAGIILGMNTMAGHVFRLLHEDTLTPYGRPYWPRNFLAVTGACLAIKASKYDEVGGLDEKFIIAGNDVAIGISLYKKGYRNVLWPFAKLYHYENVSVGSYNNVPPGDYDHSLTYYRPFLHWNDPYFNPNLSLDAEHVELRRTYEKAS
jgi:O-antigen biosynthesis protein